MMGLNHPSILYHCLTCAGMWGVGGWSLSWLTLDERQGRPWTRHQLITGLTFRVKPTHIHTSEVVLEYLEVMGRTSPHRKARIMTMIIVIVLLLN